METETVFKCDRCSFVTQDEGEADAHEDADVTHWVEPTERKVKK